MVHAEAETRIDRMVELRGMTREEATHRLNSQASDTERLAIADVVIDSNGTARAHPRADGRAVGDGEGFRPEQTSPNSVGGRA